MFFGAWMSWSSSHESWLSKIIKIKRTEQAYTSWMMDVQVTHGHLIIRSQEHHVWFKGREVDGKGRGEGETKEMEGFCFLQIHYSLSFQIGERERERERKWNRKFKFYFFNSKFEIIFFNFSLLAEQHEKWKFFLLFHFLSPSILPNIVEVS